MADTNWTNELVDQLDRHWTNHLRRRWDGLADEEYLWEPVAACWSLRPRAEATTPMAAGGGEYVLDFAHPEPKPAPVTTIAWRLGHIAVGIFGARTASHFGGKPIDYTSAVYPPTAAGMLSWIDELYDAWISGVRGLTPETLAEPVGPAEGPYAELPMASLVLHINRETIHHGAEIALLRDLYAHREGAQ